MHAAFIGSIVAAIEDEEEAGSEIIVGDITVFRAAATNYLALAGISDSQAVAITDFYCNAYTLNVSGTSISAGTVETFDSGGITYPAVAGLSATKAIACYRLDSSAYGRAVILSISGPDLSAGTAADFEAAATSSIAVARLSDTQAIVCYSDDGNSSKGTACVLDVSDTTITPGSPAIFADYAVGAMTVSVSALSSTQAIVCWGGTGKACVLDVSGATITPGSEATFDADGGTTCSIVALSSSQAIVAYKDAGDSGKGKACVLDVSGSTVTPGTPAVFYTSAIGERYLAKSISIAKSAPTKAIAGFLTAAGDYRTNAIVLDVTGSAITPATAVEVDDAVNWEVGVANLTGNTYIVVYVGASPYFGECHVLSI